MRTEFVQKKTLQEGQSDSKQNSTHRTDSTKEEEELWDLIQKVACIRVSIIWLDDMYVCMFFISNSFLKS